MCSSDLLDQGSAGELLGLDADGEMVAAGAHEVGDHRAAARQMRFDQLLDDGQVHGRSVAEARGRAVTFTTGASEGGEPAPVRIDSGVRAGDTITPHYDPMIAKLITWGADRDQARARMAQALDQVRIAGVSTNAAFLYRLMQAPAFSSADLDTGLIERERAVLDRKSTRLNSSHIPLSRMPSSA